MALFSPVLTGGIVLGCDALRRGERLEVAHLFSGFKSQVGPLIGLGGISLGAGVAIVLIVGVIFGVTYFAMMGAGQPGPENMVTLILLGVLAMLVVVALSIPLYMAVFFAPALIVLHNFKLGDALKTSFNACWRNMLPFLVWGLAALVFAILASLPLFLGWLLFGPVMLVSMYVAYRDVFFVR